MWGGGCESGGSVLFTKPRFANFGEIYGLVSGMKQAIAFPKCHRSCA